MARNEATSKLYSSISGNLYLAAMIMQRGGCVYIMTNKLHRVLYTGVTSDIIARAYQHKNKVYPNSFTAKYNCNKLVYFKFYLHIEEAIAAEKALQGGNRKNKSY
jgi:putative endonuclease